MMFEQIPSGDVLAALANQRGVQAGRHAAQLVDLYLDLLEQTLTGAILRDPGYVPDFDQPAALAADPERRRLGWDWPLNAQTMIGLVRMRNLRDCVTTVLREGVPGDFIETGVWRGGSCIYMRSMLAAFGVTDRRVWVADSFEGLPPPDIETYPQDTGDALHTATYLAVSLEEVQENFRKYGVLDDQVIFLKGFFSDTLARAPIQRLAILRLDGDMYGSTMDALNALYPKLAVGGFCIIDDYSLPNCAWAVHDYRELHNVSDPLINIDDSASFWRKAE